jgi:hypothetical protein
MNGYDERMCSHPENSVKTAQAVLQRTERNELLNCQGPTKQEFITYLEEGLVERDFRKMCCQSRSSATD